MTFLLGLAHVALHAGPALLLAAAIGWWVLHGFAGLRAFLARQVKYRTPLRVAVALLLAGHLSGCSRPPRRPLPPPRHEFVDCRRLTRTQCQERQKDWMR